MTDSANEDLVTKLNTQLNKSMVLMEDAADTPSSNNNKDRKSITINTEVQSPKKTAGSSVKSRRSILKKPKLSDGNSTNDDIWMTNGDAEELSKATFNGLPASVSRPRTVEEIVQKETLNEVNISSTFSLEDVSDSEEFWIMDIPRLIDPQELQDQTIVFDDKSKFRIKDERYCIVAHNTNHNVTCVFNSKKDAQQYKTVNVKPTGCLTIRRKLSGAPEVKPISTDNYAMQFPDNLKTRHPLFGVIRERKRRSKKHESFKTC